MMMEKKTRTIQHITWFLWFLVVLFVWACIATASLVASSVANPGCLETCGDVIVPYPFGIEDPKCAKDNKTFLLDSNRSTNPPKLYIASFSSAPLGPSPRLYQPLEKIAEETILAVGLPMGGDGGVSMGEDGSDCTGVSVGELERLGGLRVER
ncbi:hypothetical protein CFP56_028415 [Quercus suber]|uniref:Uncharacterized protein n=1 Tax=Quercus suber TaxID=58331 RepID=A0AAW0JVX7_QUESU